MPTLSLTEILNKANSITSVEDRITFLHQHNSNALQTVLKCAYDKTIEWLVPDGEPPYNPLDALDAQGILFANSTLRKMKIFIKGNGYDNLNRNKRETAYIQFLESIDKQDAKTIIGCRNGKLPQKKITRLFVKKAFPGLIEDTTDDEKEST